MRRFTLFLVVLTACNGDGGVHLGSADERCVATCDPDTWDEGEMKKKVCNSASVNRCIDECEARIAGLPTLCQTCLAEGGYLYPTSTGTPEVECDARWRSVSECSTSCQM